MKGIKKQTLTFRYRFYILYNAFIISYYKYVCNIYLKENLANN